MKKYLILAFSFSLLAFTSFSQVQATIKAGSLPSSVFVAFKSATTLTGAKFATFQFAIGIPTAVSSGITATVVSSDPQISYAPLTSTETQGAVSYKVFSFSGDGAQSGSGTTFTAGVEYNYAEVFFAGPFITLQDVRLMQVPNGGADGTVNFYVADRGTDVTNTVAQFYSELPANVSNDGAGYTGSSWASVGPIVVPVKFLGFKVTKKNNDAILNWQIENESALTDRYEIERSVNSLNFKKVHTVAPKNNGMSSNSYDLTDLNLSSVRSAGIFYYRIKQVDKDGRFVYSETRSVRLNSKAMVIGVYPNPVREFTSITIDLERDADATITINDAAGKQVQNIQMQLFKGPNIKKINMSALTAGNYMLKVHTPTEDITIPVVKTN